MPRRCSNSACARWPRRRVDARPQVRATTGGACSPTTPGIIDPARLEDGAWTWHRRTRMEADDDSRRLLARTAGRRLLQAADTDSVAPSNDCSLGASSSQVEPEPSWPTTIRRRKTAVKTSPKPWRCCHRGPLPARPSPILGPSPDCWHGVMARDRESLSPASGCSNVHTL